MRVDILLTFPIVLFAVLATVLGWVAVAQIRRSGGKRHGMWLAVFDGLLFPLVALFALIAWTTRQLSIVVLGWPLTDPTKNTIGILTTCAIFIVVAAGIVWLVWRAVNRPTTPAPLTPAGKVALGCGAAALIFALLLAVLGGLFLMWTQARKSEFKAANQRMQLLMEERLREEKQAFEKAKAAAYRAASARFGPTQGATLDRSGRGGIDLDTDRFVPFDPKLAGVPEIGMAHRWLQTEGVDVFADPDSFRPGLLFTALAPALQEVDAAFWDADPSQLLKLLPPTPREGVYTDKMTFIETPQGTGNSKTFLIRTQQGGAAILQILNATDSRATKFRYKNILTGLESTHP